MSRKYELDHAKEGDTRYFIIHGPSPDKYSYPICDSMNRHHCISPEEDESNGKKILASLRIGAQIQEIMRVYREQSPDIDTPGGLENMGDVWRLLREWDELLRR